MMSGLRHAWLMTERDLGMLWHRPWWIAVLLIQPLAWLLLFGTLFRRIVDIPGFAANDYLQFLAPGVVVMPALHTQGYAGIGTIADIESGVTNRLLASPLRRSTLVAGPVAMWALIVVVQSALVAGLATATGSGFDGGATGVLALVGITTLFGVAIGTFSIGLALVIRHEETLIATLEFVLLPLTFMSSAFMQLNLLPGWMQHAARLNPLQWAVEAGRAAAHGGDWALVTSRAGLLGGLTAACAFFAARAFHSYQRAI
jgi:ABC-2 type transport system permease protein